MQLTLRGCSCLSCTNQADFLPQNSQNSQNLLAVIFSHRFHRSAQNLLVEKGLPQISQIYTDVGGYGILAIPTQPSYCDFLPQISQICTEPSYCDFLPQISLICTEPSRCDFLPQISLICTEPSRCDFLPQICAEPSRCDFPPPTEFTEFTEPSCCDFLPQISQICTEPSCREGSPTDSTDLHRCRRVWYPAVPTQPLTQPTICVDQCNPWENSIPTERRIHRIPNTHHL